MTEHLNIFVGTTPMVSIPIRTAAAKEAVKDVFPHMPNDHIFVIVEDKPRQIGVLKV